MSQGGRYLGGEERLAWGCAVAMAVIIGWTAGRVVPRPLPEPTAAGECQPVRVTCGCVPVVTPVKP